MMVGKNAFFILSATFFEHGYLAHFSMKTYKFQACILEIQMEGRVSQNVDLGPSFFYSMKCGN